MIVSTIGNCGGEPRVNGHRITVKNILGLFFETKEGVNEILETYSSLSKEEIEDVKNYLYKLLDEKTDKPNCCKICNIIDCEEPCDKYCDEVIKNNKGEI